MDPHKIIAGLVGKSLSSTALIAGVVVRKPEVIIRNPNLVQTDSYKSNTMQEVGRWVVKDRCRATVSEHLRLLTPELGYTFNSELNYKQIVIILVT